jgi:hypothetical protein
MRTFLSLLAFAIFVNLTFAILTAVFFQGQITGAHTLADHFFYAVGSLTTSGHGNMAPTTPAAKLWTSMYVLVAWVYIFYVTINQITDVKFTLFG